MISRMRGFEPGDFIKHFLRGNRAVENKEGNWNVRVHMRMIIRPGFRANLACFVLLLLLCDKLVCGSTDYDPDHGKSDFTSFEDQWHDAARNRDVPVKIYYPKSVTGKLPIIIFSHGLGGSREGYSYLGQYWASHGYVSVHLTHHGSDTDAIRAGGAANLKQTGQALANGVNAVDRAKDVNFAIDELTKLNADGKSPLKDRLDLSSIGMAGHSFGAGTTLMISGESTRNSKSFSDRRVKCAIALCPPVTVPKAMYETAYAGIKIPLFIMTGTKDDSPIGETKAADRRVPFDHVKDISAFLTHAQRCRPHAVWRESSAA